MVKDEIKNIRSGRKDLRNFGLTIGGAGVLLSPLLYWLGHASALYVLTIGILLLGIATVMPSLLKPFHKIWMAMGIIFGWFTTRIILILLFYVVITPIGFCMRLLGKRSLFTEFRLSEASYWNYREVSRKSTSNLEKQF